MWYFEVFEECCHVLPKLSVFKAKHILTFSNPLINLFPFFELVFSVSEPFFKVFCLQSTTVQRSFSQISLSGQVTLSYTQIYNFYFFNEFASVKFLSVGWTWKEKFFSEYRGKGNNYLLNEINKITSCLLELWGFYTLKV